MRATVDAFGRLDVLVNNAGYANVNSIEDFDEDDFRAQLETNLWGVINVTRAALPSCAARARATSPGLLGRRARRTSPGIRPYQTAKWAVEGFSEFFSMYLVQLVLLPSSDHSRWATSSGRAACFFPASSGFSAVLSLAASAFSAVLPFAAR